VAAEGAVEAQVVVKYVEGPAHGEYVTCPPHGYLATGGGKDFWGGPLAVFEDLVHGQNFIEGFVAGNSAAALGLGVESEEVSRSGEENEIAELE